MEEDPKFALRANLRLNTALGLDMEAPRLASVSCATGVASIAAFGIALALLEIYPPAPGHRSALFSEVGGLLLLLSTVSFILAPVALITGVKALRRLAAEAARRDKITAWIGVTTGGLYTTILVIPMLALAWN